MDDIIDDYLDDSSPYPEKTACLVPYQDGTRSPDTVFDEDDPTLLTQELEDALRENEVVKKLAELSRKVRGIQQR